MADPNYGLVRGGSIPDYNEGSTSQQAINPRGETLVAPGQLDRTELVLQEAAQPLP